MNQKNSTKERILDVAIDLFSKEGYGNVSIKQIADEVGITKSSIYTHYSKKEDILDSILDYFSNKHIGLEGENPDENLNQKDIIAESLKGFKDIKISSKELKTIKVLRILLIEAYHNEKVKNVLEEQIDKSIEMWTKFFKNLIDKKIIENYNPRKLAESYFNFIIAMMYEKVVLKYPESISEDYMDKQFERAEEHLNLIINSVILKKESK
ncbi:TetR/AcrR family transcriptional regulator [Methanobrevibacter sp. OttesenSCG-928-K11]|nr:TetR/AcrR family transcriptional regulator [Methanobrevibacter sp. OttesenSCG-928-K11]MDL2271311.1 TetR/AcrR family transcriptional regulator [Methanobrevibacter sp. OttesenSCG-928-I08]